MHLQVGSHPHLPDFKKGWPGLLVSLNAHNPPLRDFLQILALGPERLISPGFFGNALPRGRGLEELSVCAPAQL